MLSSQSLQTCRLWRRNAQVYLLLSQDHPDTTEGRNTMTSTPDRKNKRNLLRDYYGLNATTTTTETTSSDPADIDSPSFDPSTALATLQSESIFTLLSKENDLVSEIRELDSDRKSLVYDNYSKLIAAVETIHKMRSTLSELDPSTKNLATSIEKITKLSNVDIPKPAEHDIARYETLTRILELPSMLRKLIAMGRRRDAEMIWGRLEGRIKGAGVEEIRNQCRQVMMEQQ